MRTNLFEDLKNRKIDIASMSLGWEYLTGIFSIIALSLLWPFECPSRLATIACGVTSYTAGFSAIFIFFSKGLISSLRSWNHAFLLKLLVSWLVLWAFWAGPLTPDQYRPSEGDHLDMAFYDYHAAAIATHGWEGAMIHLNFTWLSFGVVAYAATIYSLFGINILHVAFFNATAALLMALFLGRALSVLTGDRKVAEIGKWLMLLPFACYFDAIISKETLCNLLFSICFCGACYMGLKSIQQRRQGAALFVVGFLGLVLIRINVAFLVAICLGILLTKKFRLKQIVTIGMAGLAGISGFLIFVPKGKSTLKSLFTLSEFFKGQQRFISYVSDNGASAMKLTVAKLTVPTSLFNLIALSPVRLLLWFYNPYPEILPPVTSLDSLITEFHDRPEAFSARGHELASMLSVWLLCVATPFLYSFFSAKRCRRIPGWSTLCVFILLPSLVIANLSFVGGKRYRIMIEPLVGLAVMWSVYYGPPSKAFKTVSYFAIAVPLVTYGLFTYL